MYPRTPAGQAHSRGAALILVLWVTAMLALFVGSRVVSGRVETRVATSMIASAQARCAAQAGINIGVMKLVTSQKDTRWQGDGSAHEVDFEGSHVQIAITAENSKIDLNHADPELLAGLFAEFVPADRAAALADMVVDWRDSDDVPGPSGAETREYALAGLPYGPRNGPFLTVSELGQVRGFDAALVEKVRGLVTVHSASDRVDPRNAPISVLLAVPGLSREQVERFVAARNAGENDQDAAGAKLLRDGGRYLQSADVGLYTIRAEAANGGALSGQEALIRITGSQRRPYVVMSWSSTGTAGDAVATGLSPGGAG